VQAQAPLPSSGSLVTDHFYDSRGWEYKTNINWWNRPGADRHGVAALPGGRDHDILLAR